MSKVISAEDSEACQRWRLPEVGRDVRQDGGGGTDAAAPLTAGRIEELHRQAYEEGFELGKREGLEHGRSQVQEQVRHMESVVALLARPLAELDEQVVEEVSELAMVIARHIIRREIKTDPGQVVAVARQAINELPVGSREIRVYVHPEDAELLREGLGSADQGAGSWRIEEDPAMSRGGCRVETEASRVDASVERRLAAIAAELLGGERGDDVDHG